MWGTDMTATLTVGEGAACVFVAVDHCTTECIGLHAAKRGTSFEALEPIRQGVRERVGGIGDGAARGLRLRHDHGANYLADDFQQEIAFFGIESSSESFLYYSAVNPSTRRLERKVTFVKRVVVYGLPILVGSGYYHPDEGP